MNVWALADIHLSFSVPEKTMEIFGETWIGYGEKIAKHWLETVSDDDLVLLPGDISWAMKFEDALIDLDWIDDLPGTKVLLKGNHDYWWPSVSKLEQSLPKSIHAIHNNALTFGNITIGGTRLWDTEEYNFNDYVEFKANPAVREKTDQELAVQDELNEKIFARELERLKLSLSQLDPKAKTRIALTHYPPIGADLKPSKTSAILEEYKIDYCVFGHLHNVSPDTELFGEKNGIKYLFVPADHLNFIPLKVL